MKFSCSVLTFLSSESNTTSTDYAIRFSQIIITTLNFKNTKLNAHASQLGLTSIPSLDWEMLTLLHVPPMVENGTESVTPQDISTLGTLLP